MFDSGSGSLLQGASEDECERGETVCVWWLDLPRAVGNGVEGYRRPGVIGVSRLCCWDAGATHASPH